MLLETLFLIVINILVFIFIIKLIQLLITKIANTSEDRFHTIYQGGELLQAKNRRYYSNLYVLIILFLILHIIVFLIATLALIEINSNVAVELVIFLLLFVYTIIIIRKGVNYS